MLLNEVKRLSCAHKRFLLVVALYVICVALSFLLYKCFAVSLIEAIYDGRSIDALNNLIRFQHKYPLEHYLNVGDLLFDRLIYLSFVFLTYSCLLFFVLKRLIFSEKKLNFIFVLMLCLFTQRLPFILNPEWQIYYTHGFYRGGIAYQIINSGVPPMDPLFSGAIVHSPWGFPWLSAQVSRLFNVTPMHAFSLINSVAICLVAFLAYKVSGQLFKNKKANIYSALFAIFGTTIFKRDLLVWIESLLNSIKFEWRATPVFPKFIYASGDPTGLVFFLIYVFSSIQILKNRRAKLFTVIHLFSILGCGFFYAPMLPAVVASTVLLCATFPFFARKGIFQPSFRQPLILLGTMAVSFILLTPYFHSVSSGVSSGVSFFRIEYLWTHIISYLTPLAPILLLIFFSRKYWIKVADAQVLALLFIIILANTSVYFFLHILTFAEYKFLILSAFFWGIFGGVGFYGLQKRLPKISVLIILLLFLWPSANQVAKNRRRISSNPLGTAVKKKALYERGGYLYSSDTEENELYDWIKQNTSVDQVFVDSTMRLPILAQRRLLVGPQSDKVEVGYSLSMDLIKKRNGYNDVEYNKRKKLVQNIYGSEDSLEPSFVVDYLLENRILVVVRHQQLDDEFDPSGLQEIFRSCNGQFCIYGSP